jgi:versiconal hemiacetal acetate esterase
MCPAAMHPFNVPEEYKSMYKAYDETWTGAPMQDGESMVVFYSKSISLNERAKSSSK